MEKKNKKNKKEKSDIELMQAYIRSLIPNINKERLAKKVNLIFDGGAFNGFFALGVGLFLKELEKKNLTTVNKISSVSIGTLMALWYILDNPEINMNEKFSTMSNHFKNNLNLSIFHESVEEFVMTNMPSDDMSKVNGRLYISYFDLEESKRKTVNTYNNRQELINSIIRSCHVPYIVNGELAYDDRYTDGITPHLFSCSECDSIFVKLFTCDKFFRMFTTGTEVNINHRLINGVADANDFFTRGSSDMCSYVSEWMKIERVLFSCREVFYIIILFILIKFTKMQYGKVSFSIDNYNLSKAFQHALANVFPEIKNLFTS